MAVIVTFKSTGRVVRTDEKEGRAYARLLGEEEVTITYLMDEESLSE